MHPILELLRRDEAEQVPRAAKQDHHGKAHPEVQVRLGDFPVRSLGEVLNSLRRRKTLDRRWPGKTNFGGEFWPAIKLL